MQVRTSHAVVRTFHPSENLHIGTENELTGYDLVLTRPSVTGHGRDLVMIEYGQEAVKGVHASDVAGLPLAKVVVEGANRQNLYRGTPEHVGGPVRVGTGTYEDAQYSLKLLLDSFKETVGETAARIDVGGDAYYRLGYAIDTYNVKLVRAGQEAGVGRGKLWPRFRLKACDARGWVWAIRRRPGRNPDGAGTQVNVEIPFTAVGQPLTAADLRDRFGANAKLFDDCRAAAGRLVQDTFQKRRAFQKRLSDPDQVQLKKLKSYFTLHYYAAVVWNMCEESAVARAAENEEAAATKDKSAFVLLPKVRLADLYARALSDNDRALLDAVMTDPKAWAALKNRMTLDLRLIDTDRLKRVGVTWVDPINVTGEVHDRLLKRFTLPLSMTSKPLPVRVLATQKTVTDTFASLGTPHVSRTTTTHRAGTEAVIVFEVRMSGDELQQAGKARAGAPGEAVQRAIDVIKQLQRLS